MVNDHLIFCHYFFQVTWNKTVPFLTLRPIRI